MSHVHWDHIMGFPFFRPAYIPGNQIRIYGCHEELEHGVPAAAGPAVLPGQLLAARREDRVRALEPGAPYEIAGLIASRAQPQAHGGDSYGYRFERGGKVVIYSTDSEHKLERPRRGRSRSWISSATPTSSIFDAMYSLADAISVKDDWGHSSNVVGVELCQLARAKHLVLFHHEPAYDDATHRALWRETRRLEEITRGDHPVEVTAAYDGLEMTL